MDLFPSSGEWEGTTTLLGPLERANLNQLPAYISITTATYTLETRLCQWEITGKIYDNNCDKPA
jgi:hypothetical protein